MKARTGIVALLTLAFPLDAAAQYADLDSGGDEDNKKRERRDAEIREIEKGTYAKANVGGGMYIGQFAGFVNPGTSLGLAVGHDFVDQESQSMAFEAAFFQGIHNGCHYEQQAAGACSGGPNAPFIQGDLRTYSFVGLLEWSTYPTRRIGLGVRAGGGVLMAPLLMDEGYYNDEVLGLWGIGDPGYHTGSHILAMGGPTFEYYTKLNHFSVGADIDAFFATDFDIGLSITGSLKYTF